MGDSGFKGTSIDQDRRFADKESKILRTTKFPASYSAKVDLRKVNLAVMRPWMVKEVTRLLGFEDEVVVEYAMGLLEDSEKVFPDPRKIQIALTGFLESKTQEFTTTLWDLLVSAQTAMGGIPPAFIEEKKAEMKAKEERERAAVGGMWRQPTSGGGLPPASAPALGGGARGPVGRGEFEGGRGGYGGGARGNQDFNRGGRGRDNGFAPRGRDQGYGSRAGRPSRFDQPRRSRSRSRSPAPARRRSPSPPSRGYHARRRDSRSPSPQASRGGRYRPVSRSPPPVSRRRRSFSRSRSRSPRRRRAGSPERRRADSSERRGARDDTPERRAKDDTPEKRRRDETPEERQRSPSPARGRSIDRASRSHSYSSRSFSSASSRSRSRSRTRSESSVSVYRSPSPRSSPAKDV